MEQRQQLTGLIDHACAAGARKASACGLLGLSVRTLQRWTTTARGDGRHGVARGAHNALCAAERAVILQTMNRPEFADLPPSQIVPRLADQGRYLASESTLYPGVARRGSAAPSSRRAAQTDRTTSRTAGHRTQSSLQLGHHLFTVATARGVFLLLPGSGHLQPQDRWLAC